MKQEPKTTWNGKDQAAFEILDASWLTVECPSLLFKRTWFMWPWAATLIKGDFAVLLKAGMTLKQAMVYNLLSAMMAYIGMLIGTAVGQYANNITLWIFAITAGMLLFVALVDMLPEMLHGDGDHEEHGFCPVGQFILQNLGLLFGLTIMLIIALYEDKSVFDIQF